MPTSSRCLTKKGPPKVGKKGIRNLSNSSVQKKKGSLAARFTPFQVRH